MLQTILTLATASSTLLTLILVYLPSQYGVKAAPVGDQHHKPEARKQAGVSVQVLVLGDLGRSPRMQYHALSIAKLGGSVQLIGYLDTEPLPELSNHPNVTIVPLSSYPKALQTSNRALFLVFTPLKVLFQVWNLWHVLGYKTTASQYVLVQNPPSIPTLLVATAICFLRHTKLIIDWHNFGYSILALKLGGNHPLVHVSKSYEQALARAAAGHFAVTHVMASLLQKEYVSSAPVQVLHDRPAPLFQPLSDSARGAFLENHPLTAAYYDAITDRKTRLVVSSTSWTPDEDFGVLLKALCQYSTWATSSAPQLPELLVIITGKGPQQAHYIHKVQEAKERGELEMVTVLTAWLSFEDYAKLLGAADLGVSLHTSSSGVDLPMKVVDMFGAGLPVLGFNNFSAWPELVTEGINGMGFSTPEAMSTLLQGLFEPGSDKLMALKKGALRESVKRWDDVWNPVAGRFFGLVT